MNPELCALFGCESGVIQRYSTWILMVLGHADQNPSLKIPYDPQEKVPGGPALQSCATRQQGTDG